MIKFKKFWVGVGEISKVYLVLWFIFMMLFTFSGGLEITANSHEYPIAINVLSIFMLLVPLSLILMLVGHTTYCSGYICYNNSRMIYGHQWDENWRDR